MLSDLAHYKEHDERKTKDKNRLLTIIEYINALYLIELLRYSETSRIDLQIAHQFAKASGAPWADSEDMLMKLYDEDKRNLYHFLNRKFANAVTKLLNGVEKTKSNLYTAVPLEPQLVNSIHAALEQHFGSNWKVDPTIENRALESWLVLYPNFFDRFTTYTNIKEDFTAFTDLQVVDRLLLGVFDTFTSSQKDLNTEWMKDHYGPYRKDAKDGKVYVRCLCKWLSKTVERLKISSDATFRCPSWSTVLSIIYHLNTPMGLHPDRLERMYEKYIRRNHHFAPAIQYARQFSTATAEDVIDNKLPELCPFCLPTNKVNSNFFITAVYPNSLVEEYLTTQWLLEKGLDCISEAIESVDFHDSYY